MHRTTGAGNVGNLFVDGNPPTTEGTEIDASWLNDVQENLMYLADALGLTFTPGDETDLYQAIVQIATIQSGEGAYTRDGLRAATGIDQSAVVIKDPDHPSLNGFWWRDNFDSSTADDGATVLVDSDDVRWKRELKGGFLSYSDGSSIDSLQDGAQAGQDLSDAVAGIPGAGTIEDVVIGAVDASRALQVDVNVGSWYENPYTTADTCSLFRVRIDRPAKLMEVYHKGMGSHVGNSRIYVSLEVVGNTLSAYDQNPGLDATGSDVLLTYVPGGITDFLVANQWGPNGFVWDETIVDTETTRFTVSFANVPGATTQMVLKVYDHTAGSGAETRFAMGDRLVATDFGPSITRFSPHDGTDYDVLTMQNAPAEAGADVTGNNTANDTTYVAGTAAATVLQAAITGEQQLPAYFNVGSWYNNPYTTSDTCVLFRVRIDRPAKTMEMYVRGTGSYSGTGTIDVEVEVGGNTLVGYNQDPGGGDGTGSQVTLTSVFSITDFASSTNQRGSNGLTWRESVTNTNVRRFTVGFASVPGSATNVRLKIRELSKTGTGTTRFALADTLVGVDLGPREIRFSPKDGTDYDVLVMQNAPAEAGADVTANSPRVQNIDDDGRITDGYLGLPVNTSTGMSATFNPSFPLSSASSTTIDVAAVTITWPGSYVSLGSATISSLTADTAYAIFWDTQGSTYVAISGSATSYYVDVSRYISLGTQRTQTGGGGYSPPPPPPGGGGGGYGGGGGGAIP